MYRQRRQPPDESIYNLIPQPKIEAKRPPMYRSKYPPTCPPSASTFGASTASQIMTTNMAGDYTQQARNHRHKKSSGRFGPKNRHYSDPTNFLKKHSKPALPQPRPFRYTDKRKPDVVTRSEVPRLGVTSKKNFITENALAAIMSDAKKQKAEVNYLKKADFGKVPAYLGQVKQEIAMEKEYIRAVMAREMEEQMRLQPKMRLLSEEERLAVLEQLKQKWEVVNKQYQGMTHIVTLDTIGKVRRKEEYESQLQQLEKSIEKLTKKYVYVAA